jgi:hypothetical protein
MSLRTSLVAGLALATLLVLDSSPAQAEGIDAEVTAPEPTWEGQQYVGADDKGRVYILRPKDFLIYPLKNGELSQPIELERPSFAAPVPVLDAAVDDPRDWVALFGGEIRWIRAGKEVTLPELHWSAAAVALLDGRPVVAVYPNPVGRPTDRELRSVPLLMTPDGDGWSILAESKRKSFARREERAEARITDAARLLTDSRGTLWLGSTYRYRLVHFSAAGDELLTLEVGEAKIQRRGEDEVEDTRVHFEKERVRHADPTKVRIAVNSAVPAILDLTEGRDGMIYLLVSGDGEPGSESRWALDRFNSVTGLLERTALNTWNSGALSVASGRDGLYIIPFNAQTRRLFIPWERVEVADWQPVEGVKINGQAVRVAEGTEE